MSSECSKYLETIFDLTSVRGGLNAGKCFDDVVPAVVSGAIMGAGGGVQGAALGAVGLGVGRALSSPNCGDGAKAPITLLRERLAPSEPDPAVALPSDVPLAI